MKFGEPQPNSSLICEILPTMRDTILKIRKTKSNKRTKEHEIHDDNCDLFLRRHRGEWDSISTTDQQCPRHTVATLKPMSEKLPNNRNIMVKPINNAE